MYFSYMITVNIIGLGNVGSHVCKALIKANNVSIKQCLVRTRKNYLFLSENTQVIDDIALLEPADITVIAIPDDAIKEVSNKIPYSDNIVMHTSGSVGIHDLNAKHKRAVFYPLQTFSTNSELEFKDVPICVEALDKEVYKTVVDIAESLGSTAHKIYTQQRQKLHLAAVFVNNFTNQLYRIAHELVDADHISFDILKPLIQETACKVQDTSPYAAQTGPAVRNDKKTIRKHLKQLDSQEHKLIYEILTKAIQKTHGKKL